MFTAPLDAIRYHATINACDLDLHFLGDTRPTYISESRKSLDDGRRTLIYLARALYSESDILLLNGLFAAVDAKTRVLLFGTIRAEITLVLFVLHQSFIPRCDNAIVIEGSKVAGPTQ